MADTNTQTVVLCGVGGQGTILAADLLAKCALQSGYCAKVSEIHGMSQRGGAVNTVVRFGQAGVASMVASKGCANSVVAFEKTEALRNLPYVAPGGKLFVADESIKPLPVLLGKQKMLSNIDEQLKDVGAVVVPARALAQSVATAKSMNVVLLGALATQFDFSCAAWEEVITKRVPPKTVDANIAAFHAGFNFAKGA